MTKEDETISIARQNGGKRKLMLGALILNIHLSQDNDSAIPLSAPFSFSRSQNRKLGEGFILFRGDCNLDIVWKYDCLQFHSFS